MSREVISPSELNKFLEHAKPCLILDKLAGVSDYTKRWQCESWLKLGGRYVGHTHPLTNVTKEGITKWIEEVKEIEAVRGECRIEMDYEIGMQAYWSELVPLTEEERKEAEEWLEANPSKEGTTIKFRIPTTYCGE